MLKKDNFSSIEFHYATFVLQPYSKNKQSSAKLLKDIISKLNEPDFPSKLRLIDRYEGRKGSEKRRLVHISSPFERMGRRCFGKIALIKNKAPLLLVGKDIVEEIGKGVNQQFIEMTNYVIDFNDEGDPVIMVEFNSAGPRLSDIEYYLRQISTHFKIATSFKSSYHLSTNYNDLDKNIINVFNVIVKVGANNLVNSNDADWHGLMKNLNDETGYKEVRLELFYQRNKNILGKYTKNVQALKFARGIITWLKNKPKNIDYIEDLKMTYQVNEDEEPIDLDFIKNKTTSLVHVPMINETQYLPKTFKHYVGIEFNYYLSSGTTHNELLEIKL